MAGTGLTGFLQNLTGGEMIMIALVALVVLGPDRLPEMARGAGRLLHKFKTMTDGVQGEMRGVMDDPSMQPLKELGEFAARPRQKLAEYALEAEAEERARRERARAAAAEDAAAAEESDPVAAAEEPDSDPDSAAEADAGAEADSAAEAPGPAGAAEPHQDGVADQDGAVELDLPVDETALVDEEPHTDGATRS